MNEFVPKKPVGTFNFVEPETTVITVEDRKPLISFEEDVPVSALPADPFDASAIDAIVRKFILWNA